MVLLILLGLVAWLSRQPVPPPLSVIEPTPSILANLKVYVSGAVRNPGVYSLSPEGRVVDAVIAAGGALSEADLDAINLAAKLRDEMQVKVPRRSAAAGATAISAGPTMPALLDLNKASQAELEALPGIGPVTASKILAYRAEHGSFHSVEELQDAKLVNRSTYEKIKDLVVVP